MFVPMPLFIWLLSGYVIVLAARLMFNLLGHHRTGSRYLNLLGIWLGPLLMPFILWDLWQLKVNSFFSL